MSFAGGYSITSGDVVKVLHLLRDNGVNVHNSKKAYEELQRYQSDSTFFVLLSYLFGAETCPVDIDLGGNWVQYRRLAGITLKNNLERCKLALGEAAIREAAGCSLAVLVNPTDVRIARVAAQIVVKITVLTSFSWWEECGLGNLPNTLLNDLLMAGEVKTFSALYTLQYLVEDLPEEVGLASKDIIERVAVLVLDPNAQWGVRKAAFRMCSNMYEQAQSLDWNVESLSPLQIGLTSGSRTFTNLCCLLSEQNCGGDVELKIQVFRSCGVMLDYLEYFTPMPESDMARFIKCWSRDTICTSVSAGIVTEHDVQLKISAIDLLTLTMEMYDKMGGEGYICALIQPLIESLPSLVSALVTYVPMTREDVENILSEDDCSMRDPAAVDFHLNEQKYDISEDSALDDNHGTATLRSTALRCIDALCVLSSKQTFPHLIEKVKALWDGEWQYKEAAIVLVGAMANGCYDEIGDTLPAVVEQLISAVLSPSENIFVVSMSLWSLSRVLEWTYAQDDSTISKIINAFASRLQSRSKRVRHAAVTAINTAFMTAHTMGTTEKVTGDLPSLIEMVISCLPFYNDGNLFILCDLAMHLAALSEDQNTVALLSAAFRANRIERTKGFETTYVAYYINETPNVFVDKDVFSVDRAIIGMLTRFPDPAVSLELLDAWSVVLRDIIERNIRDDISLLLNVLFIAANCANVTPSSSLAGWCSRTQGCIAVLAFQLFNPSEELAVQVAAVTLLHRLLKNAGTCAFPQGIVEELLGKLTSSVITAGDLQNKLEFVYLIMLMVKSYSHESPNGVFCAFKAAVDVLRSDAFSESQLLFSQMAFAVCSALEAVPGLVVHARPDVITRIITECENAYDKSVATIHLVNVLLAVEDVARDILPDVMRLVYSWRQSACNFPGTHESIKLLLSFYSNKHSSLLREQLGLVDSNIREMVISSYGLIC
ncbi:hypothetical protein, conserved [Trypanosoma brucei gambiense DAL972]|uniref:Transportin2-like protein n=1 Tax=Trypanosoma brucei gambiense (strain MHOM/CI/86/DAL972) TaxID=679716 RepID=D0A3J8_TRYB9|nr:hypothetical protein, conserved [Trypanosoma brucei gambiense DAL972]CBH15842.1 hypothetical protein, conserved [Trypanosoma brucei gambiense DAL972]|eukprot:XP_011778106.1 hypothetical protein, conserved [Trypanosoma brucei gambiense DAL972]